MAAPADVVVEVRERTVNLCCLAPVRLLCTQSSTRDQAPEPAPEAPGELTCRGKMKNVLLLFGFMCIISCFVFASMGYIELKSCPASSRDPYTNKCNDNSYQFKRAQNYRLSAALLFILGICLIVTFIWMVKKDNIGQQYIVRTDVVVSEVTEEGLLKTPAPNLPHPRSHLHRIVYEGKSETRASLADLPHYESALKLNKRADDSARELSVTSSSDIMNLRGFVMKSVSIQVDEDDFNPPPSYSQALLLGNTEEQNVNRQNLEELDNG